MFFIPIMTTDYDNDVTMVDIMVVEFPRGLNISELEDFFQKTMNDNRDIDEGWNDCFETTKKAVKEKYADFVVDFASEIDGFCSIFVE